MPSFFKQHCSVTDLPQTQKIKQIKIIEPWQVQFRLYIFLRNCENLNALHIFQL